MWYINRGQIIRNLSEHYNNIYSSTGGGKEPTPTFLFLGVMQIVWGFQLFYRYGRFHRLALEKVSRVAIELVEGIAEGVNSSEWKKSNDIIEFFSGQEKWKARLTKENAIFVKNKLKDIIFARKKDFEITETGKVLLGQRKKALFKIGERTIDGTISPDLLNRYKQWKATAD